MPTGPCISATWSATSRPTSGCAPSACAGNTVHFVCADDAHGTPIMLAAEKAGLSPEEFIKPIQASHERDFADFSVDYDQYHSTHSAENRELAETIYTAAARWGPHHAPFDPAAVRSGQADVPAGSLHPRHLPELRHARPVRRQLRELRRDLCTDRPARTALGHVGRRTGAARLRALLFRRRPFHRAAARLAGRQADRRPSRSPTRASSPSSANGSTPKAACATGTSRATRRTSAFRFPMRRASSSMSGSTRRSAIWPASRRCAIAPDCPSKNSSTPTAAPSCITSSARTSSISTACSGRPCCMAPACACRPRCTSTAI